MIVKKASTEGQAYTVTVEDLALINGYTMKELTAEDVFVFPVRLCDNAADRDNECFPLASLKKLETLFVGKPGILDHCWSAKGQTARIFRTEVMEDPKSTVSVTGETYAYLKGWAYIIRTADTADTIAKIEGGILKEVSVGCACSKMTCSVCGEEYGRCEHRKGATYNEQLCLGLMEDPFDAYEWSFVAVPAQPAAGVTKGLGANSDPAGEEPAENNMDEDAFAVSVTKLCFGGKQT